MKKSLVLFNQEFESSSQRTPQYKEFHRTFKREFTKALGQIGCRDIKIHAPNHFDVTGFFTAPDGQMWYFSIGDLRWNKERMLIRTAKHDKDWTGGCNQYIRIDEDIMEGIERMIR